ncbi:hypothetical protein [Rhodococcus sp. 11-3]|uniref:hypothetical protein n=1 Tax=Rhodococcus sp. 11-3 TaxID=2854796 RepID=UPI00203D7DD5|nr:hypothetical protein [Rhodococcus sp. 11-3]USC16996.1 hypothetical protein KZJ41_09080 [Rhodococcus sp. 11-3]
MKLLTNDEYRRLKAAAHAGDLAHRQHVELRKALVTSEEQRELQADRIKNQRRELRRLNKLTVLVNDRISLLRQEVHHHKDRSSRYYALWQQAETEALRRSWLVRLFG